MILDRLENASTYGMLGAEIALAFDYLRGTDFSRVPDGRHELDGERVYAVISRYRPRPLVEAFWESHRRYLDVQYMVEGAERMGYTPLCEELTIRQAYDPKRDLVVYDAAGEFFTLRPGGFAIFVPHDVHAPGLAVDSPEGAGEVRKVVVKCRVR